MHDILCESYENHENLHFTLSQTAATIIRGKIYGIYAQILEVHYEDSILLQIVLLPLVILTWPFWKAHFRCAAPERVLMNSTIFTLSKYSVKKWNTGKANPNVRCGTQLVWIFLVGIQ